MCSVSLSVLCFRFAGAVLFLFVSLGHLLFVCFSYLSFLFQALFLCAVLRSCLGSIGCSVLFFWFVPGVFLPPGCRCLGFHLFRIPYCFLLPTLRRLRGVYRLHFPGRLGFPVLHQTVACFGRWSEWGVLFLIVVNVHVRVLVSWFWCGPLVVFFLVHGCFGVLCLVARDKGKISPILQYGVLVPALPFIAQCVRCSSLKSCRFLGRFFLRVGLLSLCCVFTRCSISWSCFRCPGRGYMVVFSVVVWSSSLARPFASEVPYTALFVQHCTICTT